jgi:hypothetical protein
MLYYQCLTILTFREEPYRTLLCVQTKGISMVRLENGFF